MALWHGLASPHGYAVCGVTCVSVVRVSSSQGEEARAGCVVVGIVTCQHVSAFHTAAASQILAF